MKSYIILTNNIQLQIDSKDSKTNCMIKAVPEILTGFNDASPTQKSMQENAGYVARRTVLVIYIYSQPT
jgi:hypothetical protein